METSVAKALFNAHTYPEYRKRVSDLLKDGKSSGNEQSEDLLGYSQLNETRMNRLDKTMQLTDEVKKELHKLKREYIWLVITEGWCGDAAQILPIINKMAEEAGKIELRIVFRDENEDVMKHFMTGGRRAIPKLIVVDRESGSVKGNWGDRPRGAVELVENYKAKNGAFDGKGKEELQMWYLKDCGVSTQNEIVNMMLDIED